MLKVAIHDLAIHAECSEVFTVVIYSDTAKSSLKVLTVISFPAFSGLLAKLIAAAAAAPDDIPTWASYEISIYQTSFKGRVGCLW